MKLKVEIEDNSEKFKQELERKMPEILNAMGNELYKSIYDYMTVEDIVDTGRLRGSISYATKYNKYNQPTIMNKPEDFITQNTEDKTVLYGSNVEYASYVETGTSKQKARNFIKNGTYRAIPRLEKVVENILKEE